MLGEEGGSKVHQIIDGIVLLICPERSELETAGCFLGVLGAEFLRFPDMGISGSIGVVFGECAVADDKELDIFEESGACPERIPLVSVDLVEGFL